MTTISQLKVPDPPRGSRRVGTSLALSGASRIASPFKLSFTVRSGTIRVRHRKMAEFALARSGIDAKPQVKPMDR
jgi:hypothetical protein